MYWNWYNIFKNISNLHYTCILRPAIETDLTEKFYGSFWCLVYRLCILFAKTIKSPLYVISKNNKHLHGWANREMVNCNLLYSYNWDIMKDCLDHEICKCVWSYFKKREIYHMEKRHRRHSKRLIVKAKADNKTKVNLVI